MPHKGSDRSHRQHQDHLVDIGLFAVFGDIQAVGLNFGISSQAEKCSQNQSNNRAPDDRQNNRDNDGFHLRNKERAQQLIGETDFRVNLAC